MGIFLEQRRCQKPNSRGNIYGLPILALVSFGILTFVLIYQSPDIIDRTIPSDTVLAKVDGDSLYLYLESPHVINLEDVDSIDINIGLALISKLSIHVHHTNGARETIKTRYQLSRLNKFILQQNERAKGQAV